MAVEGAEKRRDGADMGVEGAARTASGAEMLGLAMAAAGGGDVGSRRE